MSASTAIELADLADDLLREVIEVRRHYEKLEAALHAIEPTERGDEADGNEGSGAAHAIDRGSDRQHGAARSIARTAALSGASRHEIEIYLREELELEDSAGVLDDVFGDEPPTEKRSR